MQMKELLTEEQLAALDELKDSPEAKAAEARHLETMRRREAARRGTARLVQAAATAQVKARLAAGLKREQAEMLKEAP